MKYFSLFFLCLLCSASSIAQEAKVPKIGFALSGGGAKGIAHIGMLKVLEEEGIYPDFITGTSMGSIIGGLYAIGYRADDLIKLSKQIDWNDYFNDNLDRAFLPIEEKRQSDRYLVSFPIEEGSVQLPRGLVRGQKMALLLSRLTIPVHSVQHFDQFQIPYRCVATDLEVGKAVVLENGMLSDAIRASMSIPTVFEPIEIDGKLLVDGGVVRNLPVQDAQKMGADIVIALDVGGPLYSKDEFTNVLRVLEQTGSFITNQSNIEQRAMADLLIQPNIDGFSALSFEQIDTIIHRGEVAARKMLPEIRALIQHRRKSALPSHELIFQDSFYIQWTSMIASSEKGMETLRSLFQPKLPNYLTIKKIERRLKHVYTTRFFKKIDYRIIPLEDGTFGLEIRAEEQSGNYLKASANYDSDYSGGILLNTTLRNKLFDRSRLSIDLRIGENPALLAEYLVYTQTRPNVGIRFNGLINFHPGFFYEEDQFVNEFDWRHGLFRVDFFSGLSTRFKVSLGYGLELLSQNQRFFDPSADDARLKQQNLYFDLNLDTYNRLNFPTSGTKFAVNSKLILDGQIENRSTMPSTASNDWSYILDAQFSQAFRLHRRFTLLWYNYAGYQEFKNENNLINLFYIGRPIPYEGNHFPFAGLRYMELPASRFAYSGLRLQYEPWDDRFISLSFNHGYYQVEPYSFVLDEATTLVPTTEGNISGMGLGLGILTPIGPALFNTEYNFITERFNFNLRMGYAF
ncbi:MAG: patatin-like phospholipase family protein [Bacteroidota bacterium]